MRTHACLQSAINFKLQQHSRHATFAEWGVERRTSIDEDEKQEQKPAAPKDRPTLKGCQVSCWLSFIVARPPH